MTDYLESDGWLHLYSGSNTLRAYCEKVKFKYVHKGRLKHYDGGVNIGIPVFKKYLILEVEGVWINTVAKVENFLLYMGTWLTANTLNVKLQYDSNGNFIKMDGTNTIFPVMITEDLGVVEKVAKGDQTVFRIEKIKLEQTGTAS